MTVFHARTHTLTHKRFPLLTCAQHPADHEPTSLLCTGQSSTVASHLQPDSCCSTPGWNAFVLPAPATCQWIRLKKRAAHRKRLSIRPFKSPNRSEINYKITLMDTWNMLHHQHRCTRTNLDIFLCTSSTWKVMIKLLMQR